jgi:tRNA A-37 threonylcarbamoyl transferase component Bud32
LQTGRAASDASPVTRPPEDDIALDDSLIGELVAGRYRLVEAIGEGGAGRVYKAIQEPMGREVAVKMVRGDLTAESKREFASRFAREASLAGRLSHPNVVHVHDYGHTDDGEQYVVMELLKGSSLKDVLMAGDIDPLRAAWIAEGVARGLAHAHANGMVHRDIKPSNVFLVPEEGGRERPVILDFGLVKGDGPDQEVTRTGTYMGTPAYTSPEQARGDRIDGRADLYSLGVLMYRMLAGVLPYNAGNAMGTVVLHVTMPYPPMATKAPDAKVDPVLESIVKKAMEKEPERRWSSAEEMADHLEAWRAGRPPPAGASAPKRSWWLPLVGGIGAVGILAAGTLVFAAGAAYWWSTQPEPAPLPPPIMTRPAPPEPQPQPQPEPVAEPVVQPAAAEIVEAPKPKPKPKPREPAPKKDEPAGDLVVDGITFTSAHADRALAWINTATEQQLREAKVYDRGVTVILTNRPFASMQAFGDTPWIGEATVRAAAEATKE